VAEMFYDDDADLSLIQGKSVAVIGYGSQGHAHALSLRDSGVDVRIGLQPDSKSRAKAEAEGLRVLTPAEAVEEADVIVILAPDQHQRKLYAAEIEPGLTPGDTLVFGHGFNIRFGYITPPDGVDVVMIAPKGPGTSSVASTSTAAAYPSSSPSRRTPPARPGTSRSPTPRASAACAPAASRPPSPRRPRRTCSGSRRCSAAARRSW
jgi:ketol-acid reductoisomerase